MEISGIIVGLIIGLILAAIVYVLLSKHQKEKQVLHDSRIVELKANYEHQLVEAKSSYEKQITELKDSYDKQLDEIKSSNDKQLQELKSSYEEQLERENKRREEEVNKQMNLVKEQMQNTTNELLKRREEELKTSNKEQLGNILTPLQEEIKLMKEAVDKNKSTQAETTSALKAKIEEMMKQSIEIGTKADNLARALTSENKTQGNFGEVRLVELLENMGLEKGLHFDVQETIRDEEGKAILSEGGQRMIPDVILHFTDGRDAIIDSKMSLKAFEDYMNAETEEEKSVALKEHIRSVRAHVDELSKKKYDSYIKKGRQGLDYVLMYMFSESALQLALCNDTTLWKYAFDKNVFITGSQNLYAVIRLTKESWVLVDQTKNQEQIMKCADNIVQRVQLFSKRFKELGEIIGKVQDKYDDVQRTTADNGKSIIVAAKKLISLGAKEDKSKESRSLPDSEMFYEES